jgi:hypothetical protein
LFALDPKPKLWRRRTGQTKELKQIATSLAHPSTNERHNRNSEQACVKDKTKILLRSGAKEKIEVIACPR